MAISLKKPLSYLDTDSESINHSVNYLLQQIRDIYNSLIDLTIAGAVDHGLLTGLTDDDHVGYLLINGTRAMTGTIQADFGISGTASTAEVSMQPTLSGTGKGHLLIHNHAAEIGWYHYNAGTTIHGGSLILMGDDSLQLLTGAGAALNQGFTVTTAMTTLTTPLTLSHTNYTTAGILHNAVTTGIISSSLIVNADITANTITYASIQQVSATSRILGRISAGAGVIEELTGANVRTIAGLATTDSPTLTGLTLSGLSTAGYVKNSAAGVISTSTTVPLTDLTTITIPSTDHTVVGLKVTKTAKAGNTFVFGNLGFVDSAGTITLADATALATSNAVYMCADASIAAGASGNFLIMGYAKDASWAWTIGALLYLDVGQAIPGDDAYVKALLHLDGTEGSTTFTDEKGHSFTVAGNAHITTTDPKFGTGCLTLDGSGDDIETVASADFDFNAAGTFTIDFRFKLVETTTHDQVMISDVVDFRYGMIWYDVTAGDYGKCILLAISTNGTSWNLGFAHGSKTTWTAGQWYHIELNYNGTDYRLFVDGVLDIKWTQAAMVAGNKGIRIGRWGGGYPHDLNGQVDEFRVSMGICRHDADTSFTPPVGAYGSTVGGAITETAPTASGSTAQFIGVADTATVIKFNPQLTTTTHA